MIKITEHTSRRLIVESKPRITFGIIILLGLIATIGTFTSIFNQNVSLSVNDIFGIILGPGFVIGGLFLYRETTTIFNKDSNLVTWKQIGLRTSVSDSAPLDQIQDVVVGRPVSEQSGGATCLVLVLSDRKLALSFGFSAFNHKERKIIKAVKSFIGKHQ